MVASFEQKTLEIEAKLHATDAKLAELNRKSSEIERKSHELVAQEIALGRERSSFAAEYVSLFTNASFPLSLCLVNLFGFS